MTGEGIKLRDETDTFRNFGDVLDEVAGKWSTRLEEVEKYEYDRTEHVTEWRIKGSTIGKLSSGDKFVFKGYHWIVLDNNVDDGVLAIMASAWNGEEYCFDEDGSNNYAKSSLRRKLLDELLPILGEDNLIPHEVDLVADNGNDRYGKITDRLFILSCDEYRKYRKNVPLLSEYVWTCTPWYIPDAGYSCYVRFVYSTGALGDYNANSSNGVAPACVFKLETLIE